MASNDMQQNIISSFAEFPTLESSMKQSTKQSTKQSVNTVEKTVNRMYGYIRPGDLEKGNTHFSVATSRIDQLRQKRFDGYTRTKVNFSRALKATKACRHVTEGKTEDGKYGVCYRHVCTFAHSLDEYQDPPCQFGDNCRHINGKIDRTTGRINRRDKCSFKHPSEDHDEYISRTGKKTPDLPPKSEHTRKPRPVQQTPVQTPQPTPTISPVTLRYIRPANVTSHSFRPVKWVLPEQKDSSPVQFVHRPIVHKLTTPPPEWPESVESTPPRSPISSEKVIRVPAAMFEQAMQMCISQGVQNFKIETF